MPTFNNLDDLARHLLNDLERGMMGVGQVAKKVVQERLDKDVYSFDPSVYQRTRELRESVDFEPSIEGKEAVVVIDHNTDMIHAVGRPYYQHHSAVKSYTPQDYSQYVAQTVNDGTSGHIFGQGFWTKPRPYMDNAFKELQSSGRHVKSLANYLRSQGYKVEVT